MIKLTNISKSTQESQIQEIYNEAFKKAFGLAIIERKYQCDGYFKTTSGDKEVSILIEYKYDIQMKDKIQRARAIAQCLAYLRIFEQHGEQIPKLIFIGDINECLIIHTNDVAQILDSHNVDWTLAPSVISQDSNLVLEIINKVNPWVYDIDDSFDFNEIVNKVKDACSNIQSKLHITEKNIEKVYNLFCDRVIKDKRKVQANDLVGAFIGVMLDSEHYYQHPRKNNILVANDKNIIINGDQFELFMSMHNTEYSPKEKRIFTSISDRLIEDTNRRNKGEFYTPTLFVDYAHGMIEKELGAHWKENYTVWDCCCGTKNLTRDYKFKDLYCSTLEQAELDISSKYNKEATSFQFDFLNDSLDDLKVKAPGLLEAFELNKPICFFINPPYAGASTRNKFAKKGLANSTVINETMKVDRVGAASQNLYAQFLYRIILFKRKYNLTSCCIGLFSPTMYLCGSSWEGFRHHFLKEFNLEDAIQFKANNFSDVSGHWGIGFTIWKCGEQDDKKNFNFKIVENMGDEIKVIGSKIVYNISKDEALNKWCYSNKKYKSIEYPNFSSGLVLSQNNTKAEENILGYMFNISNDVDKNLQNVSIFTGVFSSGHGVNIHKENFDRCMVLFASRRNIVGNWITWADQYMIPNVEHHKYKSYVNDCLIFSLFDSKSDQSSLRQVQYHDKLWNIKNEFFWMSKQEIMDLAEKNHSDYTYEDALSSDERFVYNYIQEHKDEFSTEALAVLEAAKDLVHKSFKYRQLFDESHPECQINNWDCGFYQLKALLKEFMPSELKEFRAIYKQLADKMRPMVYDLGFLRK